MSQLPGIFYVPPQPTQLTPHWFPSGPSQPPVRSMVLWPAVIGLLSLNNPLPTWAAQVQYAATSNQQLQLPPPPQPANPPPRQPDQEAIAQWQAPIWLAQVRCKETANELVQLTIPAQPAAPPTRQPDQEAIALWTLPTWGAQSAPENTYPPQASTGPLAPNQAPVPLWPIPTWNAARSPLNAYPAQATAPPQPPNQTPIAQWPQLTWNAQEEPFSPIIQAQFVPWTPEPLATFDWPQVTWGSQQAPQNTYPSQASAPPSAPSQAPLGTWTIPSWGVQTLPTVVPFAAFLPWNPQQQAQPLWPQLAWGTLGLPLTPIPLQPAQPPSLQPLADPTYGNPQITWPFFQELPEYTPSGPPPVVAAPTVDPLWIPREVTHQALEGSKIAGPHYVWDAKAKRYKPYQRKWFVEAPKAEEITSEIQPPIEAAEAEKGEAKPISAATIRALEMRSVNEGDEEEALLALIEAERADLIKKLLN